MKELEKVYQEFDMKPLKRGDKKLHDGLFGKFLQEMKKRLLLQKLKNKKFLIPGHKGAGKSTFLNLLATNDEILNGFLVVNYSINDIGNPYDFTHYDFLLSLALKGTEIANKNKIDINETLLGEINKMVNVLQESTEIEYTDEIKKSVDGGGKLKIGLPQIPIISDWIGTTVYAALQLSKEKREKIREKYKVKPHELMSAVNNFLVALATSANKRLLYIVDDMDKLPLESSFELFDTNREFMEKPEANIIYVANIALACSQRYTRITTMGDNYFFPSLKLKNWEWKDEKNDETVLKDDPDDVNIQQNKKNLKELIYNWCPMEYIDDASVSAIIENGGGNIAETLRLLWYALDHVVIETGTQKIMMPDVDRAIVRRLNEYSLNNVHLDLLKKVMANCQWIPDKEEDIEAEESPFLDLIYNLALLEYRNGDKKWRYPNPVLMSMLRR